MPQAERENTGNDAQYDNTTIRRFSRNGAASQFPTEALTRPVARLVEESAAAIGCRPDAIGLGALVTLGSLLRRRGERVESREPLRAGYELADACGADTLAENARTELRASGIRVRREPRSGADALTASERRIAAMAAGGSSNSDIAQALFLTVKTVEMHLTSVYRKLDIHSRSELPTFLRP